MLGGGTSGCVFGGGAPGIVRLELVCELEGLGGLELPLDKVPSVVFGRVPELEVWDEVVLEMLVVPVDGGLEPGGDDEGVVPGIVRCSVEGPEEVAGIVPAVVVGVVVDVVEEVDDGGAGVEPCTQLQALLTRAVLLPHP